MKNKKSNSLVLMFTILFATICCNKNNSKINDNGVLDCSLYIVVDNYPEEASLQALVNAMPRRILFIYKIKNNTISPTYLPIKSDNEKDNKYHSVLSLYIDTFRIGSTTKVRYYDQKKEKNFVYNLSFNKYGNVVENREEVHPYTQEDNNLYPGDSIFVSIKVTDSLIHSVGLPSNASIYEIMEKMRLKYMPKPEDKRPYQSGLAVIEEAFSPYISFCFGKFIPRKDSKAHSEMEWKCDDDEKGDDHQFFSGMTSYY